MADFWREVSQTGEDSMFATSGAIVFGRYFLF